MFCARPITLSWVKRACLDSPITTLTLLQSRSRAAAVTVNMDQQRLRRSSYLTSRDQLAARLQRSAVHHFFEARSVNSPSNGFKKRFSSLAEPWNCDHDELLEVIDKGSALVVDIRRADELKATGVMYGARHIPLDELKEALNLPNNKFQAKYGFAKPKPDGSNVVFTCRSGRRSLQALEIAKEAGYTKARHYPGGWIGWVQKSKL